MLFNLVLCCLLLLSSLFPRVRVSSNESALHVRWPKYWSFTFSISPSNEYSGLISLRIDWFDLLAVQRILKSLLQHYNSKASILHPSASLMVKLSHLYMTTRKTIALTVLNFISKVLSLLFNTLSRFVITFLPRTKWLFISWLQSPSAVILEPTQKENLSLLPLFPFYLPWGNGIGCHDLCFFSCWASSQLFHSPLSPLSRGPLIPLCFSAIIVGSSAYLRLLIFLLTILISNCDASSPAFHMMYSAYELNKQGDNIQLCCTTFPILNQLVVLCPVLTVAS